MVIPSVSSNITWGKKYNTIKIYFCCCLVSNGIPKSLRFLYEHRMFMLCSSLNEMFKCQQLRKRREIYSNPIGDSLSFIVHFNSSRTSHIMSSISFCYNACYFKILHRHVIIVDTDNSIFNILRLNTQNSRLPYLR